MAKANQHPAASFIDRIVRIEEEVRGMRGDIRDIYKEAKDAGFLKGAIRLVVKRQMENEDERLSREAVESEAQQIMTALGMFAETPLGQAAVNAAEGRTEGNGEDSGFDAFQAGRKAGFIGSAIDTNPYAEDDDRHGAFVKGWHEGQARKVSETIKPADPAAAAKPKRTMSDEQKAAMKAGRERAAAQKAAEAAAAAE